MDNMENRPRQRRDTVATRNTVTDHNTNKQERSGTGHTNGRLLEKKKRRKEGRLIPGSAKMQSLIKWYVNEHTNKDNGRGQKRNARSVAEDEGGKKAAARIKQPPRKRGEMEAQA